MQGHAGRNRAASDTASPMWSMCPCVTSMTSQRVTVSAGFGLSGCPSQGSMSTVLPPGVTISTPACPSQVSDVSRPIAIECLLPPAAAVVPLRVAAIIRPRRAGGYTARVPASQIASNLALVNWTVLVGLAVGSFAVVVVARLRTAATRGYLGFTAFCAALFGWLAWLSDTGLPPMAPGSPVTADPAWDAARRAALVAFVVLALVTLVAIARGRRGAIPGIAGVVAGVAVLAAGGLTWGDGPGGVLLLSLQLVVLALATGGVFAAMILGHWYLVTPRLPEAPLVMVARRLLWVVALQVVLFVAWVGLGAGPGSAGGAFAALFGPWALFVWLRLLIGLVFPLVVSWAAVQTARTRSMESATGLLYINVGTIAAGTILAAGLYFGAGLLV